MDPLAQGLAQHRLWRLKPEFESIRVFDNLLENEFRSPQEHQAILAAAVRSMVRFAMDQVPYYARMFARLGLRRESIEGPDDLAKLATLTKHELLESQEDLQALLLPPGEKIVGRTQSSGTTGRRVSVVHSNGSAVMFQFLGHRSARWHRLDPMLTRVDVRQRSDVFRGRDLGRPDPRFLRLPHWRHLGKYFHTGAEFAFPVSSLMDQQVEMLQELRPDYAMTFPGVFEEWLLANGWRNPVDSLKCLIGIGSQLTPSMRSRLEHSYRVPIHMAYGLNEIGMVAVRCPQGSYHVHTENCLVQIADGDGKPCAPGEVGHVLITGLRNYAMPLIRYDTGDLAEAPDGACACGRTLPSFGELAGRYRRYAGLPDGSRERVRAIRVAIESFPPGDLKFLRRYQIHQDLQNRFTLRLRTVAPIPDSFRASLLSAWARVGDAVPLSIVELDEIGASPSGKLLDFVSDFHTDSAYASALGKASRPLADT